MSNGKNVQIYKNPGREKPILHTKYVPQYKVLEMEPEVRGEPLSKQNSPRIIPTKENSAVGHPSAVRQPYAERLPSPLGAGKSMVPNVGNNMEHTWSSVDGIVDDLPEELSKEEQMIDNNDFVSDAVINVSDQEVSDSPPAFSSVKDGEYVLLVNEGIFETGSLEYIQDQARSLIFGDHLICDGVPVSIDNIVVFKRVKIKVGVFLD